jgi:hypothetical protein
VGFYYTGLSDFQRPRDVTLSESKHLLPTYLQFTFPKMTLSKDDIIIKFNRSTKQESLRGKQLIGSTEKKIIYI